MAGRREEKNLTAEKAKKDEKFNHKGCKDHKG
jgi:hypothetical protein